MRRRAAVAITGLALAVGLLAVAAEVYVETHFPVLIEQVVSVPKLPPGASLRVLHTSDLHAQPFEPAVIDGLIAKARPDLAVITGDLIDHTTEDITPALRFVEALRRGVGPVYYVTGNHEWGNPRRAALLDALEARGVVTLNNRHVEVRHGHIPLNVVGVDDAYTDHADLEQALAGVNPARFTLLISHTPAPARRLAGTPVDLMLAGHTHGGQVRLPIVGALWAPGEGLLPTLGKGLYTLKEGKQLYIDSGLGTSTLPVRFLCRSQASLLSLVRPSSGR